MVGFVACQAKYMEGRSNSPLIITKEVKLWEAGNAAIADIRWKLKSRPKNAPHARKNVTLSITHAIHRIARQMVWINGSVK